MFEFLSSLTMADLVQALIFVLGVGGNILVAHRRSEGFIVWAISNFALIAVSYQNRLWGMLAMYVVYLGMCFYSLYQWRRSEQAMSG